MRKTYKGHIHFLKENQIFVFGSNTQGRHGKGAALFSKDHCGAIYGQSKGLQGKSYAICTKDLTSKVQPSISDEDIINQIVRLYEYAENNKEYEFLIPYKANQENLNSYSPKQMASMFIQSYKRYGSLPENIIFEEDFYKLIYSIHWNEGIHKR